MQPLYISTKYSTDKNVNTKVITNNEKKYTFITAESIFSAEYS